MWYLCGYCFGAGKERERERVKEERRGRGRGRGKRERGDDRKYMYNEKTLKG